MFHWVLFLRIFSFSFNFIFGIHFEFYLKWMDWNYGTMEKDIDSNILNRANDAHSQSVTKQSF